MSITVLLQMLSKCSYAMCHIPDKSTAYAESTGSLTSGWSSGRDSGNFITAGFLWQTKQAVRGSQSKHLIFSELSRVSPGDQPLTKESKDSRFQIADT